MSRRRVQVSVRVEEGLYKLLKNVCQARGEDMADFIRRAVRKELARLRYLSKEEMKALEVDPS